MAMNSIYLDSKVENVHQPFNLCVSNLQPIAASLRCIGPSRNTQGVGSCGLLHSWLFTHPGWKRGLKFGKIWRKLQVGGYFGVSESFYWQVIFFWKTLARIDSMIIVPYFATAWISLVETNLAFLYGKDHRSTFPRFYWQTVERLYPDGKALETGFIFGDFISGGFMVVPG